MKHFATAVLLALLALAGCGEPADTTGPETPADEPAQAPDPAATEEQAAAEEEQAPTEVLEESATIAEEDADEPAGNEPIKLARANVGEPEREWKFQEGRHFARLVPTQPTVGGADKIEVAEIFWYGCPHCRSLEPHINRWAEELPPNVRFVRIAATWNPLVKLHAQLYYTEQLLVKTGVIKNPEQFRAAVFAEYHDRGNRLASEEAIQALFERHGVTADQFRQAWGSFEVDRQLRTAQDLEDRYQITGVPAIVVNGKYRTGVQEAGGVPQLFQVVDELIERETLR
jgi:thiol:disulfide interchange protein DsbA